MRCSFNASRLRLGLPRRPPCLGAVAADPSFDGIDVANPRDDVTRDAGPGGFEHRHELPACMDHPNTIEKLHFKVVVPFVGPFFASSRQRRTATAD
jgi:hypothetical protein